MDLSKRIDHPELMDTETLSLAVMKKTLGFLTMTNQFFGGNRVILKHLDTWSKNWRPSQSMTLLDIGTGAADIPMAIAAWARKKGFDLQITAIDIVPEIITIAQEKTRSVPEIKIRREDFFTLQKNKERFDFVTASLLLHHIPPTETLKTLHAFDHLATRGLIISDLLRSPASYAAVKAISSLIGNHIVRHDGPLSVRRAFTPDELAHSAQDAGLTYLKAQREPWFRVSLAGEK